MTKISYRIRCLRAAPPVPPGESWELGRGGVLQRRSGRRQAGILREPAGDNGHSVLEDLGNLCRHVHL